MALWESRVRSPSSPPNKNRNFDTMCQDCGSFLFAPIICFVTNSFQFFYAPMFIVIVLFLENHIVSDSLSVYIHYFRK